MNMAEALYRKYRPQVFEEVVGQEPIERTLKNAIEQDKVSHAYLFTGPRGTGKTTTARLLAKALLCENGPTSDPDGTCDDCELIAEGTHPDVYELDAASRTGVENVREEIISRVQFAPTRGRFKVYIIDEVHMLSTAAFNALLKTLEEPPSHVVFVLCTTDPQKVPETIHSRCQRFDFRRIAPESMVSRLGAICIAEGVEFEGEALDLIAHRAEGGLRNALTSLEQIIAFENGKVTLAGAERLLGAIDSNDLAEIMAYVGKRDIANCFRWTADYIETGADLAQFVRDMSEHVRNLYVMALVGDDADIDVSETMRRELAGELQWFGPDRASRLLGVLGDLMSELKTSSNPRLSFEIALTRMVRPDSDLTIESLAERIEALESGYSAVAHVLPGQPLAQAAASAVPAYALDSQDVFSPGDAIFEAAPERVPEVGSDAMPDAAVDSVSASVHDRSPRMDTGAPRAAAGGSMTQPSPIPAESGASATPSASGGAPVSALENPASLQRIWQAALSAVKKQKQAYGVLFMNTKATYDGGRNMLVVNFSADSAFAFNAVQKPDVQDALAHALEHAAGGPVAFCFEKGGTSVQVSGGAGASRQQPQQHTQPQPQDQPRQQPQLQSQVQAQSRSQARPQPQSQSRPQTQARPQPQRQDPQPTYDPVPYEQVPYDEVPYEQVPYEDSSYDPVPYDEYGQAPARTSATQPPAPSDATTAASSIEPNLTPEGSVVENRDDVQSMLQAGFGAGVVFREVND